MTVSNKYSKWHQTRGGGGKGGGGGGWRGGGTHLLSQLRRTITIHIYFPFNRDRTVTVYIFLSTETQDNIPANRRLGSQERSPQEGMGETTERRTETKQRNREVVEEKKKY